MDFKKNYYEILEVSGTATKEEIKASYRRLAKKYHPDTNLNDESCNEKFKMINEAHQVIGNEIIRQKYDEFRKTRNLQEQQRTNPSNTNKTASRRSYYQKKTGLRETRFYVRGKIIVNFWGDEALDVAWQHGHERRYKIHPTKADVEIEEQNIFKINNIPTLYLKAYKESDLFASPLSQPIKCLVRTATEELRYELHLNDIRIKDIQLEGITKHEGRSFGLLKGDIYAYASKYDKVEEVEEVTEWFGETGRFEINSNDDTLRIRKEYYNKDGSVFWGPWQASPNPVRKTVTAFEAANGCSGWLIVPLLVFAIIFFPRVLIGLGFIAIIALLFLVAEILKVLFKGRGAILGMMIIGLIMLAALFGTRGKMGTRQSGFRQTKDSVARIITTRKTTTEKTNAQSPRNTDSLLSHYIQWENFDGSLHNITMSVRMKDFIQSVAQDQGSETVNFRLDYSGIYSKMISSDYQKMDLIFLAFDSLRIRDSLDEIRFAKAIVSSVQSLPYYLVLNKGCDDYYVDQYVQDFMKNCAQDCCVGNEAYGVRTPIEFAGDLKGDCDTRAVFLYTVLSHFGYKVALLVSGYYKHALIAISIPGNKVPDGVSTIINENQYYLWETTSKGFEIGHIPPQMSNLEHWNVALLNAK
jgi:hypothetical protein